MKDLHGWAEKNDADVVAGMDVACESTEQLMKMSDDYLIPGNYKHRMLESLDNQVKQERVWENGDYSHEFMPVIQGNKVEDYDNFIQLMQDEGLDSHDKIALGTVCKRSDKDEILEVVKLVRDYYPDKYLHLFGATLNIWKDERFWGMFDSSDTAAWTWGASGKEHMKELFFEYRKKVEKYGESVNGHTKLAES